MNSTAWAGSGAGLTGTEILGLLSWVWFGLLAAAGLTRPLVRAAARHAPAGQRLVTNLGLSLCTLALSLVLPAALVLSAIGGGFARFGLLRGLDLPGVIAPALGFVLADLLYWAVHRLSHGWPLLWRLHRVHHCDPALDVFTTYRHHRLERQSRASRFRLRVSRCSGSIPPGSRSISLRSRSSSRCTTPMSPGRSRSGSREACGCCWSPRRNTRCTTRRRPGETDSELRRGPVAVGPRRRNPAHRSGPAPTWPRVRPRRALRCGCLQPWRATGAAVRAAGGAGGGIGGHHHSPFMIAAVIGPDAGLNATPRAHSPSTAGCGRRNSRAAFSPTIMALSAASMSIPSNRCAITSRERGKVPSWCG